MRLQGSTKVEGETGGRNSPKGGTMQRSGSDLASFEDEEEAREA